MKTITEAVARAMYESHGFKKPWTHPDTVRLWHSVKMAEARVAIDAYHEWIRKHSGSNLAAERMISAASKLYYPKSSIEKGQ